MSLPVRRAAQFGLRLAGQLGSRVSLVHLLNGWSAAHSQAARLGSAESRARGQGLLEEWLAEVQRMGLEAETHLREMTLPAEGIVAAAQQENCDLIVMGTHGHTGLDRLLLGSVAERVAHRASCAVLLVRQP